MNYIAKRILEWAILLFVVNERPWIKKVAG